MTRTTLELALFKNQVSNLEPSDSEAEALPLAHCGLIIILGQTFEVFVAALSQEKKRFCRFSLLPGQIDPIFQRNGINYLKALPSARLLLFTPKRFAVEFH
ncbi:hypothetical protein AVEN_109736-1 [Araneus ventricosus]|uniref:Uncharacterized protein n=1 Tax=Araneus ventricosus TaxID=182803 RepID=A0A4Y2L1T0_ARAVE|nr:hypothetical protein AVEN_109736-1 [Araneus ventricosus]